MGIARSQPGQWWSTRGEGVANPGSTGTNPGFTLPQLHLRVSKQREQCLYLETVPFLRLHEPLERVNYLFFFFFVSLSKLSLAVCLYKHVLPLVEDTVIALYCYTDSL